MNWAPLKNDSVKEFLRKYGKYTKYAKLVGYLFFYLSCLFVFSLVTFPYTQLKEHVVASFNAQQRSGQQELQIDEMSGYWLSGVRMKGVRLFSGSTEPGQPPQKIEIDEATVRYSILSSLLGGSETSFDFIAFGGEVSGSYETTDKDVSLGMALDAVDLSRVEPLARALGLPIQGKLGGSVNLKMPGGKTSKSSGSVSLVGSGVSVGDGKAKLKGALALPQIQIGTLTFSAEAKDGVLKITKMNAGGKDLELSGDGRISLREVATDSPCDAQVRFKVNDAYRNKSDVTKSLFGTPGSTEPALLELADPRVKQSKRADGFYAWAIRGTLGKPDFSPAPGGGVSP